MFFNGNKKKQRWIECTVNVVNVRDDEFNLLKKKRNTGREWQSIVFHVDEPLLKSFGWLLCGSMARK